LKSKIQGKEFDEIHTYGQTWQDIPGLKMAGECGASLTHLQLVAPTVNGWWYFFLVFSWCVPNRFTVGLSVNFSLKFAFKKIWRERSYHRSFLQCNVKSNNKSYHSFRQAKRSGVSRRQTRLQWNNKKTEDLNSAVIFSWWIDKRLFNFSDYDVPHCMIAFRPPLLFACPLVYTAAHALMLSVCRNVNQCFVENDIYR